MDITLPSIPAGITVLLALLAPYAAAIINNPRWPSSARKLVSIVVSIVLAGIVMAGYYVTTGDLLPDWPALVLLAIVVMQASYALLVKQSAAKLERSTSSSTGQIGPNAD